MIKLNKAVIHRFVQIFLFFCGIVLVHLLALGLTSSSWGDVLRSISQQDIEQMLADIERYFFSTLLHLYIISYLLFACLPVKTRPRGEQNSETTSQFGLQAATRLHEVGIASNRGSACHGEYVPGPCTHRPSHHESRGDPSRSSRQTSPKVKTKADKMDG